MVAIMLALVLGIAIAPIAADAAQVVGAIITDPVDQTVQARVDGGSLRVGDGSGPLSVDGMVSVGGTVATQPGLPADVFQSYVRLVGPGPQHEVVFGPVDAGERLAISSLTIRNQGPNPVEFHADLYAVPTREDCDYPAGGVSFLVQVHTEPNELVHLPFPQPLLVTSASQTWCLIFSRFGDGTLDVTVVGFVA